MGLTAEDYAQHLKVLFPQGAAWRLEAGSVQASLLNAMAEELARVDARSKELLSQIDPRTTSELLNEWEATLGLPDNCGSPPTLMQHRRNAVLAKIAAVGGQSKQYFIELASVFGFAITITEFSPFTAGSTVGAPIYGSDWAYAWQVNAPLNTITTFRAGQSAAGEPLRAWGNDRLECLLTRYKPAHTTIIFSYT